MKFYVRNARASEKGKLLGIAAIPIQARWAFVSWGIASAIVLYLSLPWKKEIPILIGSGKADILAWGTLLSSTVYTGLTLLLVILTWRLFRIATEATTLTERSQRAARAPLVLSRIISVLITGFGSSIRLNLANVGDGPAYSVSTRLYLRRSDNQECVDQKFLAYLKEIGETRFDKPDASLYADVVDVADREINLESQGHLLALPKNQEVTVLVHTTTLQALFNDHLRYSGEEVDWDMQNVEKLSRDLCSALDCDLLIDVSYKDLYGSDFTATLVSPNGIIARQQLASLTSHATDTSENVIFEMPHHEMSTIFNPGHEHLEYESEMEMDHPGYWPTRVTEVRIKE